MNIPDVLNVCIALIVGLYFLMVALWRRYSAAGTIALVFITTLTAYVALVFLGATEAFK